jgi:hypothetical protein
LFQRIDETNKLISDLQDKSKGLEFGMGKLEESLRAVETENKKLKDDTVDLKFRSMRNNLLFSNIPERRNETPVETERVLRDFMEKNLKMDAQNRRISYTTRYSRKVQRIPAETASQGDGQEPSWHKFLYQRAISPRDRCRTQGAYQSNEEKTRGG